MAGLAVAATIMTLKYILGVKIDIHFLLLAPVLLIISLVVSIVVSLATAPPPADKVAENTWTKQIWIDETKELKGIVWYKNFRVQAILLVIACFVMYGLFY